MVTTHTHRPLHTLTSFLRAAVLLFSTFITDARSPTVDSNSTNFSQISLCVCKRWGRRNKNFKIISIYNRICHTFRRHVTGSYSTPPHPHTHTHTVNGNYPTPSHPHSHTVNGNYPTPSHPPCLVRAHRREGLLKEHTSVVVLWRNTTLENRRVQHQDTNYRPYSRFIFVWRKFSYFSYCRASSYEQRTLKLRNYSTAIGSTSLS